MGHETGAEHQLLLILDMWVRLKMMMEAMIEDLCMASHMGTMAERPKMEIIGWILKPVVVQHVGGGHGDDQNDCHA